jgi:membrane fusion protein, type I secretion system
MTQMTPAVIEQPPSPPIPFRAPGTDMIVDVVPATPLHRLRGPLLAGALVIAVFLGGFGIWAAFAPLESAAVAPGVVEVESSRKTVQHLEGGIINDILVKDGDHVTAGQPLVELDDVKARTAYAALEAQLFDATARETRLIAERDGRDDVAFPPPMVARADQDPTAAQVLAGQREIFAAHRNLLNSKIAEMKHKIDQSNDEIQGLHAQEASVQTKITLIHSEVDDMRQLVDRGLERRSRLSQLQRDQADIEGSRGQIAAQIDRAQQAIAGDQVGILSLWYDNANDIAKELRDTEGKVNDLKEQVRANADVLARVVVRAPEDGVITNLRIHTAGGVVRPGDALLDLVPASDRMIVTARIRPEDMDLVRTGLPALVRLLPYKQRQTPPVDGTVTYVSADRLIDDRPESGQPAGQPYFMAKISINASALKDLPGVELVPGMPAEVMIKTGKTTVALYTLSPIVDSFNRAFREK